MSDTDPVVMVCTVGETAAPLRTSICKHCPTHIIYLASPQSRSTIRTDIEDGLEWKARDTHTVTLSDYQDIVQCVKDMRNGIANALRAMSLPDDTLLIADITGGTKIMSAALALVMTEFRSRFSYMGGRSRTKDGLGIVEAGTEFVVQDANPWDVLALREVRALAYAFNQGRFVDALAIAKGLAANPDDQARNFYGAIWAMVNGYLLWDSFNHKKALAHLEQAQNRLAPYAVANPRIAELLRILKQDVEKVAHLQEDAAALRTPAIQREEGQGRAYLLDLLANAQRCAAAGHYDDAVARLSAIEKCAKAALWARHGIDNGHVAREQVPESLREEWGPLADANGVIRVGLERSYQLLAALGDPLGKAFVEQGEGLKKALQARNESLLAHGYVPIGMDKYEKLMAAALEFLKTDPGSLPAFPQIDWRALLL